jgi:LPXTG-motif cell wall-anchored protein
MIEKTKRWIIFMGILSVLSLPLVNAAEVQQVETNGTIGFTGVYEPIGTPDPAPPETIVRPPITEVAKPDGTLPQTNEIGHSWHAWLGVFLISFVFLLWKQKRNHIKNLKQ